MRPDKQAVGIESTHPGTANLTTGAGTDMVNAPGSSGLTTVDTGAGYEVIVSVARRLWVVARCTEPGSPRHQGAALTVTPRMWMTRAIP